MATTSNPIRNPILAAHLNEFKQYVGTGRGDATAFEHFVNYIILASDMGSNDSFDIDAVRSHVHNGGGDDRALDGVAIFVQKKLSTSRSDAANNVGGGPYSTDAHFYFIQTTTSPSIDHAKILKFLHGVMQFLSPDSKEAFSRISGIWDAKDYLFRGMSAGQPVVRRLRAGQPNLNLFFVYTGDWSMPFTGAEWWTNDNKIDAAERGLIEGIREIYPSTRFDVIDAKRLLKMHEDVTLRRVEAVSVDFPNRMSVPLEGVKDKGVDNAFIGLMKCREYIDKIGMRDPDSGELNQNLFIDNVRLGLGNTGVNKGIAESIQDTDKNNEFMLLNNGITIVAGDATVPSTATEPCTISNYQIVNGCQTTTVLNENYEHLSDTTFVPVKLVVTKNEDLVDDIVRATNTQNYVSPEQFKARDEIHRKLQGYYESQSDKAKGYREIEYKYKQDNIAYGSRSVGSPIINMAAQMKCYESMFDEERPHIAVGRKNLLTNEGREYDRIFDQRNPAGPFHVAGYALCEMESFIDEHYSSSSQCDDMMNYKYHLLLLFKIMQQEGELPPPNSNSMEGYCDNLRDILSDQTKREKAFRDAIRVLEEGLKWHDREIRTVNPRELARFTNKLIELAKSRTANVSRRESRAANRRARSKTAPQANRDPATDDATGKNVPQQAPAANQLSQPSPDPQHLNAKLDSAPADDDTLTGTITGLVEGFSTSPATNWFVYVSIPDGDDKKYEIVARDANNHKLGVDNLVGKVIRFREARGNRGDIRRAQIIGVS